MIAEARRSAEQHPIARPPDAIEERAPGKVDFDLLEDSDFELTERYDPEGLPDETWVSCQVLRWRTDFVPPGTIRDPDRMLEEALTWRVTQWEWIPDDFEDDEDEDGGEGEWTLRAHAPIVTPEGARRLPEPLHHWVRRMTEDAVEWFGNMDEAPDLVPAARRLKAELEEMH